MTARRTAAGSQGRPVGRAATVHRRRAAAPGEAAAAATHRVTAAR
ncbi:hypothetical protein [Streptomyces maremycinicus]|nr:hypothetical protein [Streptomyces sp. NBRC 110468]